jgi:hypothetical protein
MVCLGCILCPFRSIINKVANYNADVNVNDKTKYEDKKFNFGSDYESENPLTAKRAKLRGFENELKEAEASGDTAAIEAIKQ